MYVSPQKVVENMVEAGRAKAELPAKDLFIRGFLSACLLGYATALALKFSTQTGISTLGAIIFPVGFVMIVLAGLELVTGNFALVPLAVIERKTSLSKLMSNWFWVFFSHVVGGAFFASLFFIALTYSGALGGGVLAEKIASIAEAKTLGYEKFGLAGLLTVFVKAILCNWMVTMGVVMAMTSQTVGGKILAMWLPIFTFFALGFEHSVVNLFVIPAGMMFGANVSISQWWVWNQIPVTIGNLVGGILFTGLALYITHRKLGVEKTAFQKKEVSSLSLEEEGGRV